MSFCGLSLGSSSAQWCFYWHTWSKHR